MRSMGAEEIAAAAGGEWRNPGPGTQPAVSVSIDSREITPGCLFIPIQGKRDGHDFLDAALDAGAAGCLYSREPESIRPDRFYIRVSDTRAALRNLAAAYRREFSVPFIQITGSVGKTTTKEMTASVLGSSLRVWKTPKNYNNEIGTPLTLLGMNPDHEAAVIETGMNHAGEIDLLGSLVKPDIAVITNIGDAHMENLGSRNGILHAKCEIFNHLKPDGLAVLNGDDPLLRRLELPFRTIFCGSSELCQVRIIDLMDHSVQGISCTIRTARREYRLNIPSPGTHLAQSAAIAIAIGEELGLSREDMIRGAEQYTPAGSRMRVLHLRENRILLDDCYNANPQSVTAALEVLSKTECDKRVAVLGDMGELGGIADQAHYNVGALTAMLGIDEVIAIGERAAGIAKGAVESGGDAQYFPDRNSAAEELARQFEPGCAMLVKASHAMRFQEIVETLKNQFGPVADL